MEKPVTADFTTTATEAVHSVMIDHRQTGSDDDRTDRPDRTGLGRSRFQAWYQASRPPFFVATLIPLTLGLVLAGVETHRWLPGRFLLILLASFFVHLAANLANDLFDHLMGADADESIGGSRVIQERLITPRQLVHALIILYLAALLLAWLLVRLSGQTGLWAIVAFSGLSSLFYTAPPIRYGYRGLGELSVFLNMGLIMVGGTHWVLAEHWRWDIFWHALPIGLMVANILYYQSLPDMVTDARVGKRTLAVRLGRRRAATVFRWWWIATYGSLIGLHVAGLAGWPVWACLATTPVLIKVDRLVHTTENWLELDRYGHLIRKLYLINGVLLIVAAAV